jgi:HSP20 family protein
MELRYENGLTSGGLMFDRVNGMFREMSRTSRNLMPAADVIEDKDAYHFYFEMPGLQNESINVHVEEGRLMVEADRKRPEWSKETTTVHFAERSYGTLRRAFELPKDASHDNIRASYKDGVLDVTVDKRPETKPVKIQIN